MFGCLSSVGMWAGTAICLCAGYFYGFVPMLAAFGLFFGGMAVMFWRVQANGEYFAESD